MAPQGVPKTRPIRKTVQLSMELLKKICRGAIKNTDDT
jgi:hypothetical protein